MAASTGRSNRKRSQAQGNGSGWPRSLVVLLLGRRMLQRGLASRQLVLVRLKHKLPQPSFPFARFSRDGGCCCCCCCSTPGIQSRVQRDPRRKVTACVASHTSSSSSYSCASRALRSEALVVAATTQHVVSGIIVVVVVITAPFVLVAVTIPGAAVQATAHPPTTEGRLQGQGAQGSVI